jgi:hypothetical protein
VEEEEHRITKPLLVTYRGADDEIFGLELAYPDMNNGPVAISRVKGKHSGFECDGLPKSALT